MKLKLLSLVVGLQIAWVLGTVAVQETRLRTAPTVLLETAPVDPRDLLRGDYVVLNYRISTISLALFQPPLRTAPPTGKAIYVVLEPRGQFHEAVSAALELPKLEPGQVAIRGTVQQNWGGSSIRLDYGLERYYVPEGAGNLRGKTTVRAVIAKSGQASIKEVFLDGKPYREAMRQ